ncbi:hypothetical protein [Anaeromyxobacter paludicola]|uniref:Uncharacterized protein n=1 Tax=Anaeromyxobacter paludicola TaxID=2918171 RepID=A0ABN6N306_9BACT|nr:hypothetical protein [Anaeromyxobacter paludicola]BDG07565.1 hypothetical protein AMPC_06780 [Anaeromyxobacter paludicola]
MAKVGGEVDCLCTKCGLTLAHTVIAMLGDQPVKVECNTCHGVHKYRSAPAGRPAGAGRSAAGKPARAPAAQKVVIGFDELLRERNMAAAQRYSPKVTYGVDQVIEHPTFGLGFVSEVKDGGKVSVTFRTEVKVLVHGKA